MSSTKIASIALTAGLLAACGGKSSSTTTTTTTTTPDAPTPTAALPPGSSGFPGLDWGDTKADVAADYPAATEDGDQLELTTKHGGRDATVSFMFAANDALVSIAVEYPDAFASMPACGEVLHQVRPAFDQTLGNGGEDNLAVYWSGESFEATLACNPTEDGGEASSLSMSYSLTMSEE